MISPKRCSIDRVRVNMNRAETGKRGEECAREYLEQRGYAVVERNVKTRYSELDIVACKGQDLVFAEVRTKRGEWFGSPEDTISRKKIERLKRGALAYVTWKSGALRWRIDVLCVVLDAFGNASRVDHYESITS